MRPLLLAVTLGLVLIASLTWFEIWFVHQASQWMAAFSVPVQRLR